MCIIFPTTHFRSHFSTYNNIYIGIKRPKNRIFTPNYPKITESYSFSAESYQHFLVTPKMLSTHFNTILRLNGKVYFLFWVKDGFYKIQSIAKSSLKKHGQNPPKKQAPNFEKNTLPSSAKKTPKMFKKHGESPLKKSQKNAPKKHLKST